MRISMSRRLERFWLGLKKSIKGLGILKWSPTKTWLLIFAASITFVMIEGRGNLDRLKLTIGLAAASFAVGSLAGFLFSSYGEETATIGKIRDWLIGGITGLTIAKANSIKGILTAFAVASGSQEFAMTVAGSVTFATLGFFFMFFQRELILNVLLAESRAQRSRLDGTHQAELATSTALAGLPPNLLSGAEDLSDLFTANNAEAGKIEELLESDGVMQFLDEAEKAATAGKCLDWDIISKAANLHYYRTYVVKGDDKDAESELAIAWIARALMVNPQHADFTAKYADILGIQKLYGSTVRILEDLYDSPNAPAYIQQWLGYFLLYIDGKEKRAIHLSLAYHERFPDDDSALFNASCGYAQLFEKELREKGVSEIHESENRIKALGYLKDALRLSPPGFAATVEGKYAIEGESFYVLRDDPDFKKIIQDATK
jgi:tetratricopeptide (TPR) repeat protein